MSDRPTVIYRYDGSFEGLLCCVFESYTRKEIPAEILPPEEGQTVLFTVREIKTEEQKAKRVKASIPKKIGNDAMNLIQYAFLSCLPRKEYHILIFLRKGFRVGPGITKMLADETVHQLNAAVRHMQNENHLLLGFIRFSSFQGALIAEIQPKNFVLPLMTHHFCNRYPEEHFMIFDRTHGAALIYRPYQAQILPIENLEMPVPDEEEQKYRELWRLFYRTIEVEGRHNPKCRMSHMPKRYWRYMTEFSNTEYQAPPPSLPQPSTRPSISSDSQNSDESLYMKAPTNFCHNRLSGENKQ